MSDRVSKEEVEKAIGNLHVHSITGEPLRSQVVAADLLRRLLAERDALDEEIARLREHLADADSFVKWLEEQAGEE